MMDLKMMAGWKTFLIGLFFLVGPQIINYITNFDFVGTFGLSPNAASVVGVIMVVLRALTSTPLFKK